MATLTKKEISFCYELALFMCSPQPITVGEAAYALLGIVYELTKGNKKYREMVFEFVDSFVIDDNKYNKKLYGECIEDAIKTIKEDYNKTFFNER